ncbi:MAG: YceI family protein [Geminicoccaceae bacterium]|nr:YceI family protein [Geminicoccaceae bacterium]MCX8101430.1 YceI family protein [Geminicoccaceae bacterium]MDW8370406.1 YceI family protein [Geminicoccaceae bacterium]
MRWHPLVASLLASLLFAAPVAAAPGWTLVPEKSRLAFEARQGTQPIQGSFARWTAAIRFDPEDLAGSAVEVEVELASVSTGDRNRDQQAQAREFFDVARTPRARYRTVTFRPRSEGVYEVEALLEMKGITRPLRHPVRITIDGDRFLAEGEARLLRREFRFGEGVFDSEQILGPEILVRFAVEARRS